ncbi:hypothetical protein E2C01_026106 [Portunus trituberculatus]|uniref:Uncharacterized protein n=1 Tax=Portunus trituberculatus TaxID=210409 RepID=A0A5B7EH80_PORTR|nr:hypothetical protein [Portunus trituberculatus]
MVKLHRNARSRVTADNVSGTGGGPLLLAICGSTRYVARDKDQTNSSLSWDIKPTRTSLRRLPVFFQ